jgi:predicted RNase H-like HicB family nuclease
MTDTTRRDGLPSDLVLAALRTRGFECEVVGDHVVATRDAQRVVVPGPGRALPLRFVDRLEHSMRPVLGRGWIDASESISSRPRSLDAVPGLQPLDAVVDRCSASGQWCAYLPSEHTVMGFGATRDEALLDLREAAALWIGIPADAVEVTTPL